MTIETSAVIRYLKILLIFIGAVSLGWTGFTAMKACLDRVLVIDISAVWTGFTTAGVKPLYLYVVINVIIITLVFASRFQQESIDDDDEEIPGEFRPLIITAKISPAPDFNRLVVGDLPEDELVESEPEVVEVNPVIVNGSIVAIDEDTNGAADVEAEKYSNFALASPLEAETGPVLWPATEKPLSDHKPPFKVVGDVVGHERLRLSAAERPKQHETLENTWRMITEQSRRMQPARQLKRSDSFESASDEIENHAPQQRNRQDAFKSRTFNDRTNYDSPKEAAAKTAAVNFRKEPSLSQDELNRRVEAFINKFNEEMRLQREQSIQQHMEMINRGAY